MVCADLNRLVVPSAVTIGAVKRLAVASTARRLVALEQQFIEIARITKGLRRYLDEVAETVRIAVEELSANRNAKRRAATVKTVVRRPGATTSRPRASRRAAPTA